MTEHTVTVREARAHFADHIDQAEEGVPTVITRNGAPVAAVVPISDFEALEEAADVMLRVISRLDAMRILTALTALGDEPYRQDADVEKLTGPSGLYRLRVGSYRVAYQIDDGELVVLVVKVGDRRDVHRNL
ncbi:type II toxin-antitoxin system prevent-host-death family antitoxin [Streptomyces sp. NRRL WC-3719]